MVTIFLIFIIPYLFNFFCSLFFFQHADVHATACWRIGSYAPGYAIILSNHGDLVLFKKKSIATCVHMIYIIIKVNTCFFSAFFFFAKTRFLQMSRYYPISFEFLSCSFLRMDFRSSSLLLVHPMPYFLSTK